MEDFQEPQEPREHRSVKGYQIVIVILALILGALSFLYLHQVRQIRADFAVERDTLNNRISGLVSEYDNIRTVNDTLTQSVAVERGKADSLLQRLRSERSLSRQKILEYEKELGTLRNVARGFVQKIDSLNRINTALVGENVEMRKQMGEQRQRADLAEEKAQELGTQIRKGSVLRARDIALLTVGSNDKPVTRASRAKRLRIDFVLAANDLSKPGERNVYARLTGPDGYILSADASAVFDFEGDRMTYSAARSVDYQNQDLPVSIYYNGPGVAAGKFKVALYADGFLIGTTEVILR